MDANVKRCFHFVPSRLRAERETEQSSFRQVQFEIKQLGVGGRPVIFRIYIRPSTANTPTNGGK